MTERVEGEPTVLRSIQGDRPNFPQGMETVRKVDLINSGLLWLFNKEVFHPRGYMLGVAGSDLVIVGDGTQPVKFPDTTDEQHNFDAIRKLMP